MSIYLRALDSFKFNSDAGPSMTVRDYLCELLKIVWSEGESFSGKRPFGNSGWERDLHVQLIEHGYISGELDSDGFIESFNEAEAHSFVNSLIHVMCYSSLKP